VQWVKRYLGPAAKKRLILSHNKNLNRGTYLIDDRPNNGAKEFGEIEGQTWIHFGTEQFPDWDAVLSFLDV
jgi:5'(3')-deoxyribonucleotidase